MRYLICLFFLLLPSFLFAQHAQPDASRIQALQAQVQQLDASLNHERAELQTDQQALQQDAGSIQSLQQQDRALASQNDILLQNNQQLAQSLMTAEKMMQQNQKAIFLDQQTLPSFNKLLLSSSTKSLNCAQNGLCQLSSRLPIVNVDQLPRMDVNSVVHGRYFMPISMSFLVLIVLLLMLIIVFDMSQRARSAKRMQPRDEDVQAVSGENLAETKLDMARALIEMGEHDAARDALKEVMRVGDDTQQETAESLMKSLKK